MASREQYIR